MSTDFLPYLTILIAIGLSWKANFRFALIAVGSAVLCGLLVGRLTPAALISIAILMTSGWLANDDKIPRLWRIINVTVFLLTAIAMSNHLAPGFLNLLVYDKVRFSDDSVPFTMYLNFDKTLVGLTIYLFFLKAQQATIYRRSDFLVTFHTLALLVVLLMPLSIFSDYARFDLKFPANGWIWILNNLFFVCLAEEALFRGIIQGGLQKVLPKARIWSAVSIGVAALAFGAAHYRGGFAYVGLATIAGLFYGYAYWKTNRLEASILVHFGLNLIHFVAFSYPALIR